MRPYRAKNRGLRQYADVVHLGQVLQEYPGAPTATPVMVEEEEPPEERMPPPEEKPAIEEEPIEERPEVFRKMEGPCGWPCPVAAAVGLLAGLGFTFLAK